MCILLGINTSTFLLKMMKKKQGTKLYSKLKKWGYTGSLPTNLIYGIYVIM